MTTLLAYLWTPLLMAALALGIGLLVERLIRWPLPSALLAPLGVAAAIPVTLTIYRLGGTSTLVTPVVIVAAVAGFALARRDLGTRLRPGWAAAAALLAYLLYVAPAMLTGHWTFAGYNFVNDTSVNMGYVDLLIHHGISAPAPPFSTTTKMQAIGVGQHYPMGVHALLAAVTPVSGVGVAAIYQTFIGAVAAAAAAAFTQLARRAGAPGPVAALVAVFAVGANLLYQYGQHGAIKEVLAVMLVVAAAAVVAEALVVGVRAGTGVALALCLVPTVLVLSVGGVPYALLAAALGVAALLVAPKRPPLRLLGIAAAAGLATAVVATVAVAGDVISYGQGAGGSFEGTGSTVATPATFGHLLRPLPAYQAAGIWLGEDYRIPVPDGFDKTAQTVLITLLLALALGGLIAQVRRRRFGGPVLLATCGLTALLVAPRLSPYADAKLLVILAPPIVFMAGIGVWELSRLRLRAAPVIAVVLAVAIGGGIAWSDATAAHEARFAPDDRLESLEDAADHAGRGYWLLNEWEEYSKYFLRDIRANSGAESDAPDVIVLRTPGPIFGQYFDLDEQALDYLQRFDGIMVRRSPVASRPPADFGLAYTNRYYELWRRDRSVRVREHLPLGSEYDAGAIPVCTDVRALARRARTRGDELVAAPRRETPTMNVIAQRSRPIGWPPDPSHPGMVILATPGVERGTIRVPDGGRFRAWLQLSSGRPMEVRIDGKLIGSPQQVNTPEQWLEAGEITLAAGKHRVELRRRGGRPLPGDGYNGLLGPLALAPIAGEQPLERVDPKDAPQLCDDRWDWIEAVER